jgi:hypothetical protein
MLACHPGRKLDCHMGFILIEVLVSVTLLLMVASAAVGALSVVNTIRQRSTQHAVIGCSTPDCARNSDYTVCTCGEQRWLVLP